MAGSDGGVARWVVRRRAWIAPACLLLCLALFPASRRIESALDVAARVDGSESADVEAQLTTRFASPFGRYVVLVAPNLPSPATGPGATALRELCDSLRTLPGVTQTIAYLDHADATFIGANGRGTFVIVGLDATARPDT